MEAKIESSTKDYLFATWQSLILALFRGSTTAAGVREGQRIFDLHAKNCAREAALLLTIVEEQAPMPDGAARAELGKLLERAAGRTKKSAVVYEGDGFRAAAVRSVVTGLLVFSKPPFPHKIFARVSEAVGFLVTDAGPGITANQLVNVISDVRQRHLKILAESKASAE